MYQTFSCDQLKSMMADALDALHSLRTGRQVRVVVDQNGDRVEFTAANQAGLITYINQLQSALQSKGCVECSPVSQRNSGPMGFIF